MTDVKKAICDLQSLLLILNHQSDEELYRVEGQKMEAIIRQLRDTNRDGKRKMMGTVVAKFCTEYLEAQKAHRDGREYKFTRDWRKSRATVVSKPKGSSKGERPAKPAASKGKAPKQPVPKPPTIDLKNPPRKEVSAGIFVGIDWPGTWEQGPPPSKKTTAAEQPVASSSKTPAQQPTRSQAGSSKTPATSTQAPKTSKPKMPSAPKAPAGEPKKPVKTVAAKQPGESAPKTLVGSNQGSTSKTLAVQAPKKSSKSLAMDVDEPAKGKVKLRVVIEIPGGKSGETSKAAGEKEKAGGGKGKGKEIAKQRPCTSREEHEYSEALYDPAEDSDSSGYADEPVGAKRKGKSGQKGSTSKKPKSVAILSDTGSESSIPIIQRRSLPTKKSGKNIGQYLPTATVDFLLEIRDRKEPPTAEEKQAYDSWLAGVIKTNLAMKPKKERSNTNKAAILLGQSLDPPAGLVANESPCDYCKEYCPVWCLVMDQGTSCLMCNFFRHSTCKKNGNRVMEMGSKGLKNEKSKSKAGEKGKSKEKPVLNEQLWAEVQFTQAQQGSAIWAIQSQMDAMTLGMAACGSLLKDAKQKVQYHSSIRTGVDETVADSSKTLAESIEKIIAGCDQLKELNPGVPHHLLEDHIKNLNALISLGSEFSQTFQAVADDAHRATVALGEWLQGSGKRETASDVEMAEVDDSGEERAAGNLAQSDQGSGEEEGGLGEEEGGSGEEGGGSEQ
ncbi:hypothetical protein H1R20_g9654, partial [Candolleomyces eurysporus]